MSNLNLEKINKLTTLTVFVFLVLIFVVALSARTIVQAYFLSEQIETSDVEMGNFLNETKMNDAYKIYEDKKKIIIDLKL